MGVERSYAIGGEEWAEAARGVSRCSARNRKIGLAGWLAGAGKRPNGEEKVGGVDDALGLH